MTLEPLTVGEFQRSMDRLHGRFDSLERRVDECVVEVATVRTVVEERTASDKKQTRNSASGWSAAVAGGLIGAIEIAKVVFTGKF